MKRKLKIIMMSEKCLHELSIAIFRITKKFSFELKHQKSPGDGSLKKKNF